MSLAVAFSLCNLTMHLAPAAFNPILRVVTMSLTRRAECLSLHCSASIRECNNNLTLNWVDTQFPMENLPTKVAWNSQSPRAVFVLQVFTLKGDLLSPKSRNGHGDGINDRR